MGKHEAAFGYHYDGYNLTQTTYNTNLWQYGDPTTLSGRSAGRTQTQAIYLQDAWKFYPDWTLTLGGREEMWRAFDGMNTNTKGTLRYPQRYDLEFSPKASLAYQVIPELNTRFSFGKAYRFPTVNEMFQQVTNATSVIVNNPSLVPEQVMSYEWTNEVTLNGDVYRISLFEEDRRNALFSQTDTTVSPNVTQIENVGLVRFRGVEAAIDAHDVVLKGLDFQGNVTFAKSRILSDPQSPAVLGKNWPRIPDWRAKAVTTYHVNDDLTYSIGIRYAGRTYQSLNNADINPDTYGGISTYFVTDMRATYKITDQVTFDLGVDNANDYHYYVSPHPYPQTTFFGELKFDY